MGKGGALIRENWCPYEQRKDTKDELRGHREKVASETQGEPKLPTS